MKTSFTRNRRGRDTTIFGLLLLGFIFGLMTFIYNSGLNKEKASPSSIDIDVIKSSNTPFLSLRTNMVPIESLSANLKGKSENGECSLATEKAFLNQLLQNKDEFHKRLQTFLVDVEMDMSKRRETSDSSSTKNGVPTVVLLISNMVYSARFEELIITWHNLTDTTLAMIALDNETKRFFEARGVPSIEFDIKLLENPGDLSMSETLMRGKLGITHLLMLVGYRVMFTEMDIYCRKNPLLLDKHDKDFMVTSRIKMMKRSISTFT